MTDEERNIHRKLRVLQQVERVGNTRKAYWYFRIGRSDFYQWCDACPKHDEAGLITAKPIPHNPANHTPPIIRCQGLWKRVCICAAYIIWGQFGSLSRNQEPWMQGVTASLSATVSTVRAKARRCVNCTPNSIKSRFEVITFMWMLGFFI